MFLRAFVIYLIECLIPWCVLFTGHYHRNKAESLVLGATC